MIRTAAAWPAGEVRAAEAGGPQALLGLARKARGPITELTGPDRQYAVTFVCQGRPGGGVGVFCPAVPGGFGRLTELDDGVFRATFLFPAGLRVPYHFCLDPPPGLDEQALRVLSRSPAGRRADRLNPDFDEVVVPGLRLRTVDSVLTLPDALPSPATRPRPGVPAGRLDQLVIDSQAFRRRKEVLVYRPARPLETVQLETALPAVLLLQGAREWEQRAFLDNLLHAMPATPFTAVLLHERSYLAMLRDYGRQDAHASFVVTELIPALRARGVLADGFAAVAGFSAGGLAAAGLAAEPGLFPALGVISGALHLGTAMDVRQSRQPGPEPLLRRFAQASAVPGRTYLAAGRYEDAWDQAIVDGTAALAAVLRERGAEVRHELRPTGHDGTSARAHLAEGLAWLLAG
jgi:enterochelin esterase-like enzyme